MAHRQIENCQIQKMATKFKMAKIQNGQSKMAAKIENGWKWGSKQYWSNDDKFKKKPNYNDFLDKEDTSLAF